MSKPEKDLCQHVSMNGDLCGQPHNLNRYGRCNLHKPRVVCAYRDGAVTCPRTKSREFGSSFCAKHAKLLKALAAEDLG